MLYTKITMLVLRNSIIDRPVMSLRTGRQVATAVKEIINPNNLKIEGFYCIDSIDKKKQLVLLYQDIRDVLPAGLVVDDHDVLSEQDELIRLQKTIKLAFELIGKTVVSENKKRLGKVSDYAVEPESMLVKKIYVAQSIIKNFTGGTLSIDRTQIIEITNKKIIVKDPLQPVKSESAVPLLNTAPAS
jgi:sporulation protein YlmC with PRC-barrel domain